MPVVHIPARLKAVRSLEKGIGAYRQPRELIFVHQAKLLEDYEDDYMYEKDVFKIFPTYQSLDDEQLRGYMGWRTLVRGGTVTRTSQAFAHLYIYELLNLIGCSGPEDAFGKLAAFLASYRPYSRTIVYDEDQWLNDMTVYYGLAPSIMEGRAPMIADRAMEVLLSEDSHSCGEIFDAIAVLSGCGHRHADNHCPEETSPCGSLCSLGAEFGGYTADPGLFIRTASAGYRGFVRYFEENRKTGLFESWVGKQINEPVKLFQTAVVYMPATERSYDYRFSGVTVYHCERGRWAVRTYRRNLNNRNFADYLRTVDYVVRTLLQPDSEQENYGFQTRWMVKLLSTAASGIVEERRKEEASRIEIDLSALDVIRSDAALTRDRLMTEEEAAQAVDEPNAPEDPSDNGIRVTEGLSDDELRLIISLLNGEDLSWASDRGLLISVLADSVNEKLYDIFADNVIDCGAQAEIVEDYREDLLHLLEH